MRRIIHILTLMCLLATTGQAQMRKVQYRPYTDLRTLHFGILVGLHLQDIELKNVGPQNIQLEDGTTMEKTIVCDDDRWNAGFSVGVLADLRLSKHFNLRFTPTMHFGAKHLTFHNLTDMDYLMAGINPMLNLTSKNQDYLQLKRTDLMLEVGLGCDFYLPFFKLIPELKFCYSLKDALDHGHADELKDENMRAYTNAVTSGHSNMIVLTFYFE